jgi:hypothetical protein
MLFFNILMFFFAGKKSVKFGILSRLSGCKRALKTLFKNLFSFFAYDTCKNTTFVHIKTTILRTWKFEIFM